MHELRMSILLSDFRVMNMSSLRPFFPRLLSGELIRRIRRQFTCPGRSFGHSRGHQQEFTADC